MKIYYWALIIVVSLMPALLGYKIYDAVDCTKLDQSKFIGSDWNKANPNKTFNDFVNNCNSIHILPLIIFIPLSPFIGYTCYRTIKLQEEIDSHKQAGSNASK